MNSVLIIAQSQNSFTILVAEILLEIARNPDIFFMIIAAINIALGIVAAFIANHNERDPISGFLAGLFFGPLGVAMYAIMGETVELRIALEEKERRRLRLEYEREEQEKLGLDQYSQDS